MTTNAQAALMAAASYMRPGNTDPAAVVELADYFKGILDATDREDKRKVTPEPATPCAHSLFTYPSRGHESCMFDAGHSGPHLTKGGVPWTA